MKKMKNPPKFTQAALWSYRLTDLDLIGNKNLIITQILNFGSQKMVKWLMQTYGLAEIKTVVKNPDRGSWWERTLNHWAKVLNIEVDPIKSSQAIIKMSPQL